MFWEYSFQITLGNLYTIRMNLKLQLISPNKRFFILPYGNKWIPMVSNRNTMESVQDSKQTNDNGRQGQTCGGAHACNKQVNFQM